MSSFNQPSSSIRLAMVDYSSEPNTHSNSTTAEPAHHHHDLPTFRHFLAAGVASAVASGLFNPLDCLRVRWQVQLQPTSNTAVNVVEYGKQIIAQEGLIHGLWRPGLGANMVGMAIASSIRFGYYESVRNSFASADGNNKNAWHMVGAGLICGASAYAITTPFHLIKTQAQAYSTGSNNNSSNFVQRMVRLVAETGQLSSLYKGAVPLSFRGSLFTAGQMVGYDGLKTVARDSGFLQEGPLLHAASSISASFFASFLSAPADYIMTRYVNSSQSQSLVDTVRCIYGKEGGITAFWKGWNVFFIRLTPVMLTYSTVYEQMRHSLGLGYLN